MKMWAGLIIGKQNISGTDDHNRRFGQAIVWAQNHEAALAEVRRMGTPQFPKPCESWEITHVIATQISDFWIITRAQQILDVWLERNNEEEAGK